MAKIGAVNLATFPLHRRRLHPFPVLQTLLPLRGLKNLVVLVVSMENINISLRVELYSVSLPMYLFWVTSHADLIKLGMKFLPSVIKISAPRSLQGGVPTLIILSHTWWHYRRLRKVLSLSTLLYWSGLILQCYNNHGLSSPYILFNKEWFPKAI